MTFFKKIVIGGILLAVTFLGYQGLKAAFPDLTVEEIEGVAPAYLASLDVKEKLFEMRTYAQNIEHQKVDSTIIEHGNFGKEVIIKTNTIVVFDTISVPVYQKQEGKGLLIERWELIDTSVYKRNGWEFVGRFGDPLWLIRRKKITK